jgi:hypothetical protein
MSEYGIAYTQNDSPTGEFVEWVKVKGTDTDAVYPSYELALEANDIEFGWIGYVREYPSGKVINPRLLRWMQDQ